MGPNARWCATTSGWRRSRWRSWCGWRHEDELLRSLPQADDALIKAETAADEDLEQQAEETIRLRNDVQSGDPGAEPGEGGRRGEGSGDVSRPARS